MRHEIPFEETLVGAIEAPEELIQTYQDHHLVMDHHKRKSSGAQKAIIEKEANAVYEIWKANGFRPVRMSDAQHRDKAASEFCTPENQDYFIQDYPLCTDNCEEDPDSCFHDKFNGELEEDNALTRYVAMTGQAQQWCEGCPLKTVCLASSITQDVMLEDGSPSTDSEGRVKLDNRAREEEGVYGAYGPRSREAIQKRVVKMLDDEYGDIPSEYRRTPSSEGGFYGYDRDEFGVLLNRPKNIFRQLGPVSDDSMVKVQANA